MLLSIGYSTVHYMHEKCNKNLTIEPIHIWKKRAGSTFNIIFEYVIIGLYKVQAWLEKGLFNGFKEASYHFELTGFI